MIYQKRGSDRMELHLTVLGTELRYSVRAGMLLTTDPSLQFRNSFLKIISICQNKIWNQGKKRELNKNVNLERPVKMSEAY